MSEEELFVSARPVKSFFVNMLTRDILLEDAILDLLDNCIDGALRSRDKNKSEYEKYSGFKAELTINKDIFRLEDNCGGICWDLLKNYAFRMGRVQESPSYDTDETVGTYGIGMKRAIFKIGTECIVRTQSSSDGCFEVNITPHWITTNEDWDIPVKKVSRNSDINGTSIEIKNFHNGIKNLFDTEKSNFLSLLTEKISTTYSVIMAKGFNISLNGKPIIPKPITLIFDKNIQPYIYKKEEVIGGNNLSVFVAVGLTAPLLTEDELAEKEKIKYSSQSAGWTIICNDRVVLYCDKTELTGWGTGSVPQYHTQFISISGIVEFSSKDSSLLPTTTTKRGVDAANLVYLRVREKMCEGMKIFTSFTNKWKGKEKEIKEKIVVSKALTVADVKLKSTKEVNFSEVRRAEGGQVAKPTQLPEPLEVENDKKRITFTADQDQIQEVARFLKLPTGTAPSKVGEKAFNYVYEEADE